MRVILQRFLKCFFPRPRLTPEIAARLEALSHRIADEAESGQMHIAIEPDLAPWLWIAAYEAGRLRASRPNSQSVA